MLKLSYRFQTWQIPVIEMYDLETVSLIMSSSFIDVMILVMLRWTYLLLLTFKYVDTANYVLIFSFLSQQERKITLKRTFYKFWFLE